jgi:hypothetical protein
VQPDEPIVELLRRLVGQRDGVSETDQLIAQILDPIECFPFLMAAVTELARSQVRSGSEIGRVMRPVVSSSTPWMPSRTA